MKMGGIKDLDIESPIPAENFGNWRDYLGKAKLSGQAWLEVDEQIFNHLTSGAETPSIWVEGVQIFKAGEREKIERRNSMNVDQYIESISVKAKE